MKELAAKDVMRIGVITLPQSATVTQAAKALTKNNIGSVIVLERGKPVGIVTERDIVRKVVAAEKSAKLTLDSIMSSPIKGVEPDVDIEECARIMRDERIKRLPVISKGNLIGILSEGDIVRVSPALFDIIRERAVVESEANETFAGVCESCYKYSEGLKRVDGKLLCENCE